MRNAPLLLVVGFLLAGCDAPSEARACTANTVYGIWVHVTDSVSGAPLSGAKGQVRSGSYTDSLRDDGAGDGVYIAAREAGGTFSMHLERAGYGSRDVNNIFVTSNGCHVDPTVLYLKLVAVPISLDYAPSQTINMMVGQELDITLQTIGPGAYDNPAVSLPIVQFLDQALVLPANPGGPKQRFRFVAQSPGQTVITVGQSGRFSSRSDTVRDTVIVH